MKAKQTDLTAGRLRYLFNYDPETGIFTRAVKPKAPNTYVGQRVGWTQSRGYMGFPG